MASTIDLLPTIAGIAGAPLPEKKIDGVSILPLLKGKNENPRDVFYFYYGNALQAIRQGRWKLHFPYSYRSYKGVEPGKNGYPGSRIDRTTELELYDLKNDISERNNVIDQHGDVVRRLEKLAEKARRELGDSLTKRKGQEIRPAGKL
jgi:arylsulfatase